MFKQATLSVLRVLQKLSNASLQLRTVPEAWREDEDMDCISGPDTFEALNKELNEAQQSLKVRDHEDLPLPACFGRCGQRSWTTSCQRRAHSRTQGSVGRAPVRLITWSFVAFASYTSPHIAQHLSSMG